MKPYYQKDNITIYYGDCLEVMPGLDPVDLVLTDPPYGIERFKKGFGLTRFKGHGCENDGIVWDIKPTPELLRKVLNAGKNAIVWGYNNLELPKSEYFLVWYKKQTVDNFASAELAFTNIKLPAKVFEFSIHKHNQIRKLHPTQKPVCLMSWCIGFTKSVDTILDPFLGSGTTLIAAIQLNRKAIGIEISEEYCEIAANRVEKELKFDRRRLFKSDVVKPITRKKIFSNKIIRKIKVKR